MLTIIAVSVACLGAGALISHAWHVWYDRKWTRFFLDNALESGYLHPLHVEDEVNVFNVAKAAHKRGYQDGQAHRRR